MNNKALTLSVVMGVLAVVFVQSYVSSIEEAARKRFGTEVLVVSAKQDIKEMDTIDETMLDLKPIPKTFLEPAAVSFVKGQEEDVVAAKLKEMSGVVAIVPIKAGEQVTLNKITEPSLRTGLSPQITPGRRALTVPVTETSGVGKLVKPGDRVDLMAIVEIQGNSRSNPLGARIAKTILQDVVVLAVGRNVTNNVARVVEPDGFVKGKTKIRSLTSYDQFTSVTVEVEPVQAQMLGLVVSGAGTILLTLRNNDDTDRVTLSGMTMADVLGVDAAKVAPPIQAVRQPAGGR